MGTEANAKQIVISIICYAVIILGVQKLIWSGLKGILKRDFRKTDLPFLRPVKVLYSRGPGPGQFLPLLMIVTWQETIRVFCI